MVYEDKHLLFGDGVVEHYSMSIGYVNKAMSKMLLYRFATFAILLQPTLPLLNTEYKKETIQSMSILLWRMREYVRKVTKNIEDVLEMKEGKWHGPSGKLTRKH